MATTDKTRADSSEDGEKLSAAKVDVIMIRTPGRTWRTVLVTDQRQLDRLIANVNRDGSELRVSYRPTVAS